VAKQQQEEWANAHSNLGNMVQWIEPLLIAVFGAADADAVCDAGHYTEGSFRNMATGWGIAGSTDVRTFKDVGTGRYVKDNFDWLFPNSTDALPAAYRQRLTGCFEVGMGADIRTKSDVDERDVGPNDTLPPMTVGRGIEIRVFDNFPTEYVPQVYRLLTFVAEAGRRYTAPEYVYGDTDWTAAVQSVMREGWNAILPVEYVHRMAEALDLSPSFADGLENFQAFTIYSALYEALWDEHSQGMWSILMIDELPKEMPVLNNPNRESWELGAINMGFTPSRIIDTLGLDVGDLPRSVSISDLKISDDKCVEDQDDLVYLAETFGMVSDIVVGSDGKVKTFSLQIADEWEASYFIPPTCKSQHDT